MKKIFAILMIVIMCLSTTACGTSNGKKYKLGEKVSTDIIEFTLDSAEFAVALRNVNDENYFTPKEYNSETDSKNPFVAPVGHTYAFFSYTVNNINRSSTEFHNGSFATVEYKGKKYNDLKEGAYYYYEDKQVMDSVGKLKIEKGGEWHSNPSNNFLLITTGEKESRRAYVDISTTIEDLTEDITITFSIPNSKGSKTKFTYVITKEDREGK